MRSYQQSHDWITFTLDLKRANYRLWMLLGRAVAGCGHVARMPLKPELAKDLLRLYIAKGVLATTAIEGNTLTEEEVQKRIEGQLKLPPSKEYLGQEIDNVVNACNDVARHVLEEKGDMILRSDEIKRYNALILKDLPLADEDTVPGEIRRHQVIVGRYRGAPPEDLDYLLEQLCDWLNTGFKGFKTAIDPLALDILRATLAHVYIAWIHPFGDGNGRVARLVELQILLAAGVPMTAVHLLSNHYNQTRTEYYRLLDLTHRDRENGVLEFIQYALQGFVDSLDEQIQRIQDQQLRVLWRDYVYDQFKHQSGAVADRQRKLVLDLSELNYAVPLPDLRHISPRIAEAYAGKTDKTVQRDVNELERKKLVEKIAKRVRTTQEKTMLTLLPPQRRQD